MRGTVTPIMPDTKPEGLERVVLQFGNRVLRGFADREAWDATPEDRTALPAPAGHVLLRAVDSDHAEEVSLDGLKAAFFVKRFDGPGLDEMRFHDHLTPPESLWVRVTFQDGEVIEGLVENGARPVLDAGFFLTPTDPEANHWLVYIAKGQVQEFQVLGLRAAARR